MGKAEASVDELISATNNPEFSLKAVASGKSIASTPKKAAPKQAVAKKSVAKKSVAKKSVAKKSVAKKSVAKEAAPKSAAEKAAPAKKAAAAKKAADRLAAEDDEYESDLSALIERLDAARLDYEELDEPPVPNRRSIRIRFPSGDATKGLLIASPSRLRALLDADFENLHLSPTFQALIDQSHSTVEARVFEVSNRPSMSVWNILANRSIGSRDDPEPISLSGAPPGVEVAIGPPSLEIRGILGTRNTAEIALKVSGISFADDASADRLISELADALFLSIDMATGLALGLRRAVSSRPASLRSPDSSSLFDFPKRRYEMEPASLYWYGRSARANALIAVLGLLSGLGVLLPGVFATRRHPKNFSSDQAAVILCGQ